MIFAGEKTLRKKERRSQLMEGSCGACLLRCCVWDSGYSEEEMSGWGKGEVHLTLGMKER